MINLAALPAAFVRDVKREFHGCGLGEFVKQQQKRNQLPSLKVWTS